MKPDNAIVPVERLVVVPRRQYTLWIGTAAALLILLIVFRALATNPAFGWDIAGRYIFNPSILKGLLNTLLLTATIMVASIVIGAIIAIMRLSPSRILNAFASVYIWFFRGTPALIQLIFWFNLAIVVREISLTLPIIGTVFAVKTNDFMTPSSPPSWRCRCTRRATWRRSSGPASRRCRAGKRKQPAALA